LCGIAPAYGRLKETRSGAPIALARRTHMRSEARTARSARVRVNQRAKLPRISSIARFESILTVVRFSELCGRSGHQPSPKQDPGGLVCQFICASVFAGHSLALRPARVGCRADRFD